jgi:hypothetical protein
MTEFEYRAKIFLERLKTDRKDFDVRLALDRELGPAFFHIGSPHWYLGRGLVWLAGATVYFRSDQELDGPSEGMYDFTSDEFIFW